MLDFLVDPINATFGGSSGMRDDTTSSLDPSGRDRCLWKHCIVFFLGSEGWAALVTSGQSHEKRGENVTDRYKDHFYSLTVEAGFMAIPVE